MLAPHAVDIAVIISSFIASLCFTFAEPFDNIFLFVKSSCALVSGNTNKTLRPKEGRSDRPSEWIRARSLNSYFVFCKIVVKIKFVLTEFICNLSQLAKSKFSFFFSVIRRNHRPFLIWLHCHANHPIFKGKIRMAVLLMTNWPLFQWYRLISDTK